MSFVTLRRYIDNNLRSPSLSTNTIAKTFGLSRASLCRLFTPAGGVAKYIRKAKLNRAYQDIAASEFSNRRIGPIAYRMGFKNLRFQPFVQRDLRRQSQRSAGKGDVWLRQRSAECESWRPHRSGFGWRDWAPFASMGERFST